MTEIPETAVVAAAEAMRGIGRREPWSGDIEDVARLALEAAAPLLAEAIAQKIAAHAQERGPLPEDADDPDSYGATVRRTRRRAFGIAARVAAGAFYTDADLKRLAVEAIGRGDFIACDIPEVPR